MFCANCGTKQNEGEKFCPNCGTKFEELKIVKEEMSVDTSKQTLPNQEKAVLQKGTETIIEEVKVSDVVNKEEVNKENASTPTETIKIGGKEECIKIETAISTIKPKVETVIDNYQPQNKLKDTVAISEEKTNSNFSKNEAIAAKNIVENCSANKSNTTPNIIQREPFIDEKDEISVLKWAIRYEFGLGVAIDINEANKYYSILGNNVINPQLFLTDVNTDKQTGIISDKYEISTGTYFDLRPKLERERKVKINKIKEMYNNIQDYDIKKFKLYIEDISRHTYSIELDIKLFNNINEKHGFGFIAFDKNEGLVEGLFKRKYTKSDMGFWESCLVSSDDKSAELYCLKQFENIAKFCDSIKIKL